MSFEGMLLVLHGNKNIFIVIVIVIVIVIFITLRCYAIGRGNAKLP